MNVRQLRTALCIAVGVTASLSPTTVFSQTPDDVPADVQELKSAAEQAEKAAADIARLQEQVAAARATEQKVATFVAAYRSFAEQMIAYQETLAEWAPIIAGERRKIADAATRAHTVLESGVTLLRDASAATEAETAAEANLRTLREEARRAADGLSCTEKTAPLKDYLADTHELLSVFASHEITTYAATLTKSDLPPSHAPLKAEAQAAVAQAKQWLTAARAQFPEPSIADAEAMATAGRYCQALAQLSTALVIKKAIGTAEKAIRQLDRLGLDAAIRYFDARMNDTKCRSAMLVHVTSIEARFIRQLTQDHVDAALALSAQAPGDMRALAGALECSPNLSPSSIAQIDTAMAKALASIQTMTVERLRSQERLEAMITRRISALALRMAETDETAVAGERQAAWQLARTQITRLVGHIDVNDPQFPEFVGFDDLLMFEQALTQADTLAAKFPGGDASEQGGGK